MSAKPRLPSLDRIDAFACRPYIAGHEQVVYDHACCEAPPPYRYGTDARSRVIVRAAGSAAHSPVFCLGFGLIPPSEG